jgi:hypothetical protein
LLNVYRLNADRAVLWLAAALSWSSGASAQLNESASTRTPKLVDEHFMDRLETQTRFTQFSQLSPDAKSLLEKGHAGGVPSVIPTWQGAFTYEGTIYPYTMVGNDPAAGGETTVATDLIMLNFMFDEFVDAAGQNIIIDSEDITDDVIGSPNFVPYEYQNGRAQFGDAVQRASFAQSAGPDWHTTLGAPRVLTPVTIEVPTGLGEVVELNGKLIGIVNIDFLFSQLQTILQIDGIRTDEIPMLISHNVATDQALGFHSVFEVPGTPQTGIQTYLWSTWLDADAVGPILADATTITHEISEWISDPFINNLAPYSAYPGSGSPPVCSDLLEVGDAIEFLPNQMFPIELNGHVYHTQVEATLQWFSREVPSSAFDQAYSFPDTTVLLGPSEDCPSAARASDPVE